MMGNVRCSEERCSDVTPRYGARDKCDRTRSWRASLDEGSISPLPTKKPSQRGLFCLWESGTDLLSRGIPRTIIGAAPFHGPVRDGKAWFQSALGTRHSLSPRCSRSEANSGGSKGCDRICVDSLPAQ